MIEENSVRILAVASSGGHWVQLCRLRPAWEGCSVAYVTTEEGYRQEVLGDTTVAEGNLPRFYTVLAANRWQKIRLVRQLTRIIWILLKERPQVIISTGAAPGFFALKFGKIMGARTIWIDSIANAEELSLSGQKAETCADLWLTQWEHLEGSLDQARSRPTFKGSVV